MVIMLPSMSVNRAFWSRAKEPWVDLASHRADEKPHLSSTEPFLPAACTVRGCWKLSWADRQVRGLNGDRQGGTGLSPDERSILFPNKAAELNDSPLRRVDEHVKFSLFLQESCWRCTLDLVPSVMALSVVAESTRATNQEQNCVSEFSLWDMWPVLLLFPSKRLQSKALKAEFVTCVWKAKPLVH